MFKKKIDYLVIPKSSGKIQKERRKKAIEELHKRQVNEVIILNGKNSEEDILYLGKIVKEGDRVGFDTFPLHYREYKEIVRKAKKIGKFPKRVKTELVEINQTLRRWLYGELGLIEEKAHKEVRYKGKDTFWDKIKGFVKRILEG